jgi:hypothetical protein
VTSIPETALLGLHTLRDYEPLIGVKAFERIAAKAAKLRGLHTTHISSTYYGGGVAEILSPLTLLMNECGIETDWHIIQGHPEFFAVTKAIHNGLQGAEVELTPENKAIYEEVTLENAIRMHMDHDVMIVHDPQPLRTTHSRCPLSLICRVRRPRSGAATSISRHLIALSGSISGSSLRSTTLLSSRWPNIGRNFPSPSTSSCLRSIRSRSRTEI